MFRTKNTAKLFALLTICAFLLSACGGTAPPAEPDVSPVTANVTEYVNTVEEFGNTTHSSVRISSDGRFVLRDNYSAGTNEMTGTWTLSDGSYTLSVESATIGNFRTVVFEVKDDLTLVLKTPLIGSKAEQIFSADPDAEMVSLSAADDFPDGTYHNISATGYYRSYIVIYPKGKFSYVDSNDANIASFVISGKYTHLNDRLSCTYKEGGSQKSFDLQIRDDGVLILLNDVGESRTGHLFSMDQNVTDPNRKIPCDGIVLLNHRPSVYDNDPGWNIQAVPYPEDTTDEMFYYSGDPSILQIDQQGNVTVYKAGDTFIRVVCGGAEETVYVSVHKSGPFDIFFDPGAHAIDLGDGVQLNTVIIGGTGSEKVTYRSIDPSIATVSAGGYVTGVFPGQTRVVASLPNGLEGYCNIYVNGETVVYSLKQNVTVHADAAAYCPIEAFLIVNHDTYYNRQDIRYEIEFETTEPTILTYHELFIRASASVTKEMDIPYWFVWTDGSSLQVTSPVYTAHVVP